MGNETQKNTPLENLFWDYNFSEKELQDILSGKKERVAHLDKKGLYVRMLTSLDWYSILGCVGKECIPELLSNDVLNKIHSKNLQKKYGILKRILSQ